MIDAIISNAEVRFRDDITFSIKEKPRSLNFRKRGHCQIIYLSIPQAKAASIKARSFITAS